MKKENKFKEMAALLSACTAGEDVKRLLGLMLDKLEAQEKEIAALRKKQKETEEGIDILMESVHIMSRIVLDGGDFDNPDEIDFDDIADDDSAGSGEEQAPIISIWLGND